MCLCREVYTTTCNRSAAIKTCGKHIKLERNNSCNMSEEELAPINEQDFKDLKERMKLIVDADPTQYHNDFSLRRYLRAFKTTDAAFQVSHACLPPTS